MVKKADQPTAQGTLFAFVPTPTGTGYWMIMEDGSVYAFGDAQYHGRLVISSS